MNLFTANIITTGVLILCRMKGKSGSRSENPFEQVHRRIKQKKETMKPLPIGPGEVGEMYHEYDPIIARLSGFPKPKGEIGQMGHKRGYKPNLKQLDEGRRFSPKVGRNP